MAKSTVVGLEHSSTAGVAYLDVQYVPWLCRIIRVMDYLTFYAIFTSNEIEYPRILRVWIVLSLMHYAVL